MEEVIHVSVEACRVDIIRIRDDRLYFIQFLAFDQQAQIGLFNLSCLAQALLPLLHKVPQEGVEWAKQALGKYQPRYEQLYAKLMQAKLGLETTMDEDPALVQDLLGLMEANLTDYTILFRSLAEFTNSGGSNNIRDLFMDREGFDAWGRRYAARLHKEDSNDHERHERMNKVNPKYILRNYLAEVAIRKAEDEQDYTEIDTLFRLLQRPFDEQPEYAAYAGHPPAWAANISVSCSS